MDNGKEKQGEIKPFQRLWTAVVPPRWKTSGQRTYPHKEMHKDTDSLHMTLERHKYMHTQMRKGEHPATFSERLLETFKTFSGDPGITQNDVRFKSALISKCDPLTHSAVTMLVTPQSDYSDIIAKMTQFYNNNANTKKTHPVSVIGAKSHIRAVVVRSLGKEKIMSVEKERRDHLLIILIISHYAIHVAKRGIFLGNVNFPLRKQVQN